VAEGVETPEQLEFLRGEACAEVQGYLIGRPASGADIAGWTGAGASPISLSARKRRTSAA
jgi:EAL domain-containing protein (putative c-di-GMP-specific phosphodiesterase class I)